MPYRCRIGFLLALWMPLQLAAQGSVTLGFKAGGCTVIPAGIPPEPGGGTAGVFVGYRTPACRLGVQVELRYRALPRAVPQPELLTLAQLPVDPKGHVSVYAGPAFRIREVQGTPMQQIRPELVSGVEWRLPLSSAWTVLADSRVQASRPGTGEWYRTPRRQLTLHLSLGIGLRMLSIRPPGKREAAQAPQPDIRPNR